MLDNERRPVQMAVVYNRVHFLCEFVGKVGPKVSKRGIAVRKVNAIGPRRYRNSHAISDHSVLPATRQS